MFKKFNKILTRYFSSQQSINEEINLSQSEISNILKNPSFIQPIKLDKKKQIIKKEKSKPETVFDLNKTKLDDMLDYFKQTKDIDQVNNKFGTNLTNFKFGLPIPNIDPHIKGLDELAEELNPTPLTPVENLYNMLQLDGDSSYDQYEQSIQKKYNFSQLLGDKKNQKDYQLVNQIHDIVIPQGKLKDEKFMNQIRKTYSININIPGCLEMEDPNRFIDNLRPIEEFRHTPIVPISERALKEFEDKKKNRQSGHFYWVYSNDKFLTVSLFLTTALVILYMIKILLKKEEDMMLDFYQKKMKRSYTNNNRR